MVISCRFSVKTQKLKTETVKAVEAKNEVQESTAISKMLYSSTYTNKTVHIRLVFAE